MIYKLRLIVITGLTSLVFMPMAQALSFNPYIDSYTDISIKGYEVTDKTKNGSFWLDDDWLYLSVVRSFDQEAVSIAYNWKTSEAKELYFLKNPRFKRANIVQLLPDHRRFLILDIRTPSFIPSGAFSKNFETYYFGECHPSILDCQSVNYKPIEGLRQKNTLQYRLVKISGDGTTLYWTVDRTSDVLAVAGKLNFLSNKVEVKDVRVLTPSPADWKGTESGIRMRSAVWETQGGKHANSGSSAIVTSTLDFPKYNSYLLNFENGALTKLTNTGWDEGSDVSPDGKWVMTSSSRNASRAKQVESFISRPGNSSYRKDIFNFGRYVSGSEFRVGLLAPVLINLSNPELSWPMDINDGDWFARAADMSPDWSAALIKQSKKDKSFRLRIARMKFPNKIESQDASTSIYDKIKTWAPLLSDYEAKDEIYSRTIPGPRGGSVAFEAKGFFIPNSWRTDFNHYTLSDGTVIDGFEEYSWFGSKEKASLKISGTQKGSYESNVEYSISLKGKFIAQGFRKYSLNDVVEQEIFEDPSWSDAIQDLWDRLLRGDIFLSPPTTENEH